MSIVVGIVAGAFPGVSWCVPGPKGVPGGVPDVVPEEFGDGVEAPVGSTSESVEGPMISPTQPALASPASAPTSATILEMRSTLHLLPDGQECNRSASQDLENRRPQGA